LHYEIIVLTALSSRDIIYTMINGKVSTLEIFHYESTYGK